MISLYAASNEYGNNKQYIARITGRDPKFTFCREFIGRKDGKRGDQTTANVDEPGLYELCNIDKKGRKDLAYRIVIEHDGDLRKFGAVGDNLDGDGGESLIMTAAKRLDAGESLVEIIEVAPKADGSLGYRLRSKAAAVKASAAVTLDSATEACWQVLQSLPERDAKKVLAALKLRVSPPPKPTAEPAPEPLPVAEIGR